ncbi:MAG TPA: PilN domain-containing protein [Stellaceae bacterium]|nr:PilN domain-containing protein [Stellaceae bacterium]
MVWWLSELAASWHDLRRALTVRGRRSITIEAGERYWLLRQGERPIGQIETQGGDASDLLGLIPPAAGQRAVIVEIPPERTLVKTIALPAEAKGRLDSILGFEIARHFPFPAERVYFQHRLVKGDGAGSVRVEIVVVPREVVDGICIALAAIGLRTAVIAVHGSDANPLFLPLPTISVDRSKIMTTTRLLGIATAFAAIAALISWPLAQQAALRSIDREIAELKPRAEAAARAGETERRAGERNAAIVALQSGRPPLVSVLDALSRDVPDGAWLLSLSVSGREVTLDGLAPSAATVALALEKTHDASAIVFRSSISREASGLEHFQLGATLNATPKEAKP